jgi:predicted DNA-binding transcriptional regulator AlpA
MNRITPAPTSTDKLLSVSELRELYSLTQASIYRWRKDSQLVFPVPIRVGERKLLFRQSEVESWLESRRLDHE